MASLGTSGQGGMNCRTSDAGWLGSYLPFCTMGKGWPFHTTSTPEVSTMAGSGINGASAEQWLMPLCEGEEGSVGQRAWSEHQRLGSTGPTLHSV